MTNDHNILCVIPARGGSKGVKIKNIRPILGKPLIGYTIEGAMSSKLLNKIVVSTDSDQIAETVSRLYPEAEIIKRPAEMAKDDSPIEDALLHAVEYLEKNKGYKTEIVVLMQANVPIRKPGIVDDVIEKLIHSDADSCTTCYRVDQIPELMKYIDEKGYLVPLHPEAAGIRRQEYAERFLLDGNTVAIRAKNLFETRGIRKPHIFLGKKMIPIIQEDSKYTLEVDQPDELAMVEYFLKGEGIM